MFYDVFCKLCEERGLTPSGAASKIGFNRASVTMWKSTGRPPKPEILDKIAAFFDVTTDFLLEKEPKEKPTTPAGSELEDLVKDELVGFYGDVKKELTQEDVQDIITLMKIRAEINRQKGK